MPVSANRLGRYELRREIARSNDVVYEAWDPTVNRRVAIKELVMPPGVTGAAAEDRIQRFYREARAAGGLAHPNVVTIYEVGEDAGRHFIAMEYLDGPTLRERLQGGQSFPPEQAAAIAAQVADALDYAHGRGVIHRDVKPDNIHLLQGDLPKLTDFGIARIETEHNITVSGQVFGTPAYMSPEQVAGGEIGAGTDIFSLGVMLFEMVTGRKPFVGESVVTITYNIVNETPVIPQEVPEWLARIIRRAIQKDPQARYASAAEMANDLRARRAPAPSLPYGSPGALVAPPVSAPPPRQAPPLRIPVPRLSEETVLFVGALAVTLFVGALIWWGIWASGKAYQQQRAQEARQALASRRTQAVQAYKDGRYAEAGRLYKMLYEQSGEDADKWMWARSHIEYGWQVGGPQAVRHFREAASIAPALAQPPVNLATYLLQMGQPQPALQNAEAALARIRGGAPDAEDMRGALASIYLYLGDYAAQAGPVDGAGPVTLWQRAVEADPLHHSNSAKAAMGRLSAANPGLRAP